MNDVFKAWTALKTEEGVPLIIAQHGGHFGMTPWNFEEEHQKKISDFWISWGWSDKNKKNVKPIGNLFINKSLLKSNPNGFGLLLQDSLPRFSYRMFAAPVSSQWLSYFDDQCRFISKLPDKVRQDIIIRLYPIDFGWCQKHRWRNIYPNIQFDYGKKKYRDKLKQCRISISSCNATSYLESLSWNFPTIIFWDSKYWELSDETKPYFELLKSVKIFHETPEEAASHLIDIWTNIQFWWESKDVQLAREKFCNQYSNISKNVLGDVKKLLHDTYSK